MEKGREGGVKEKKKEYLVYILQCSDNTFYTGICVDIQKRLRQHNGEIMGGAKYTRCRRPVKMVYAETLLGRSAAQKREAEIKKMTRIPKEALIKSQNKK